MLIDIPIFKHLKQRSCDKDSWNFWLTFNLPHYDRLTKENDYQRKWILTSLSLNECETFMISRSYYRREYVNCIVNYTNQIS